MVDGRYQVGANRWEEVGEGGDWRRCEVEGWAET